MIVSNLASQLSATSLVASDPVTDASSGSQIYEIKSIPGKGKGLIAVKDIEKGARILCEGPLFTTTNFSPIELMESSIANKVKCLSKIQQREFLSLHNNFPGK